jgi:short chain dehydrogenase
MATRLRHAPVRLAFPLHRGPTLLRRGPSDELWRDWKVLKPFQPERYLTTLTSAPDNSHWKGPKSAKPLPPRRDLSTTPPRPQELSSFQKKLVESESVGHRFNDFELNNRVFIVTGGARGLGLTLAEALVEAGGHVYCLDRLPKPHSDFEQMQSVIPPGSGSLHYERVDVRDSFDVEDVVGRVAGEHGRLDGLIAAAGIQRVQAALEYPPSAVSEMMDMCVEFPRIRWVGGERQC